MNGQEIPGFYFDTEKQKYFAIQNATASQGFKFKHSASNVQKLKREKRVRDAADVHGKRVRKERVYQQYASHFIRGCHEREIGLRRPSYYLQDTLPNAFMSGISTEPKTNLERPWKSYIRLFAQDPVSKTVYTVHGDNSIMRKNPRRRIDQTSTNANLDDGIPPPVSYAHEPWDEIQRTISTVSSLTYLPTSGALAATTYGSDRSPIIYLTDPDHDGPYVCQQYTPKACSTIFCAAARPASFQSSNHSSVPASGVENLAVGASSSLLLLTRGQAGDWDFSTPLPSLSSDLLALNWISNSTVALGCRDGKILLYDSRSGGSSHILTHPFPISKIARADDETRMFVSGLGDTLCLYDMRHSNLGLKSKLSHQRDEVPKTGQHQDTNYNTTSASRAHPTKANDNANSTNHPHRFKRRKQKHKSASASKTYSSPIITFPHSNRDDLELDIAVHSRLGIVAAIQDSDSDIAIRVWNMWTGKTVKEIPRGKGEVIGMSGMKMRSLEFVEDGNGDGNGDVEMWATWGGGIAKFGW